jgi:hypothetical protein
MTTIPFLGRKLPKKPSFHRMAASTTIPDYYLSCGNKNDFQEGIICNLWLLLLTGYICYQFPTLAVLLWLVLADFIMAQTISTGSSGLDHASDHKQRLVPDDYYSDDDSNEFSSQVKKSELAKGGES